MENINRSIRCTADECRHHCRNCSYCSLDRISVGSHKEGHTDCLSYDGE